MGVQVLPVVCGHARVKNRRLGLFLRESDAGYRSTGAFVLFVGCLRRSCIFLSLPGDVFRCFGDWLSTFRAFATAVPWCLAVMRMGGSQFTGKNG